MGPSLLALSKRRWNHTDVKLVAALLVFVALAACGSDDDLTVLTDADSTNEIHLEAGEQFEVRLESNPTTGYMWEIADETGAYAVELRTREFVEPDSDVVGAAGEDVFVFEAVGDAEVLRLEYIRSFDDPVVPERIVEYIIRVDDAPWPPVDVDPPSTSSATAPIEVAELLAGSTPTDATVVGFVVIDDGGSRLCETLAESFPPQCGGAAVAIANPDTLALNLEQEQSVRWTSERVQLPGTYDGTRFTLTD